MQFYKQTTRYSNAAASLMLILNHYNKDFEINKENEYKIWHNSVVLPTRGSSLFSLAMITNEHKINTKLIVGSPEFKFPNYKYKMYSQKEVYQAKFSNELYYKKALDKGIDIEERNFEFDEVKEQLKDGKFLLLRLDIGPLLNIRATCNYLFVYAYGNGKFLINDTKSGKPLQIKEELMKVMFNNVKIKCKRDNRMLILG